MKKTCVVQVQGHPQTKLGLEKTRVRRAGVAGKHPVRKRLKFEVNNETHAIGILSVAEEYPRRSAVR